MLEVKNLHHAYGTFVATENITFEVRKGELVTIVGPSGCGKSTLLKCLAGLLKHTSGTIALHGNPVQGVPEGLAMVFQDYARSLYPWMTVARNVALPLKYLDISRDECRRRVGESLEAVDLTHAGEKYPWQLSGGMQQRVAIARALAYRPNLLLMDEPFASVDAQTRAELEDLVLDVRRRFGMTVLVVTHDIDEAVYLADRVVVLCKSPSRVIAEIAVTLPGQRDQIETKALDRFVRLRSEVAQLIRSSQRGARPTIRA